MTRASALRELLAKVEAGDALPWPSHRDYELHPDAVWKAFNGSLDAAKALHEAVPTPDAIMSDETAQLILFGRDGARTWLIWKLKALIAQEGE